MPGPGRERERERERKREKRKRESEREMSSVCPQPPCASLSQETGVSGRWILSVFEGCSA